MGHRCIVHLSSATHRSITLSSSNDVAAGLSAYFELASVAYSVMSPDSNVVALGKSRLNFNHSPRWSSIQSSTSVSHNLMSRSDSDVLWEGKRVLDCSIRCWHRRMNSCVSLSAACRNGIALRYGPKISRLNFVSFSNQFLCDSWSYKSSCSCD